MPTSLHDMGWLTGAGRRARNATGRLAKRPRGAAERWIVGLLLAGVALLYLRTMVPGVFDGDFGEFQYMPRILGIPHPTGYPLYLLLGWLWSWLPTGSLAYRMNLFSLLWALVSIALLFQIARGSGIRPVAAAGGALALAVTGPFWRFSGLAAVYTLHTALLLGAVLLWFRWDERRRLGDPSPAPLWQAALATGLALTNHPTAAFLVPAVALFVLVQLLPRMRPTGWPQPRPAALAVAALCFALPAALYLYFPIRLAQIGRTSLPGGLIDSVAAGRIAPFVAEPGTLIRYITGQSLLGALELTPWLLVSDLPALLVEHLGDGFALLGALGALWWLRRRPRRFALLLLLFTPTALFAIAYAINFAERGEIAHLGGHLLAALVVFALWVAAGLESLLAAATRLSRRAPLVAVVGSLLIAGLVWGRVANHAQPTTAAQVQSQAIDRYWREILSYPLEPGAALTGHWGDLTAFWYFQHAEGLRRDLRAIFPPDPALIRGWLADGERPLYIAGPLLGWSSDLTQDHDLIPWGILTRVAPAGSEPPVPALHSVERHFGPRAQPLIRLEGFDSRTPAADRRRVRLLWRTLEPTPRDLALSLRLIGPEGEVLHQQDGRLASLWYPEGTIRPNTPILTVVDLERPAALPVGTTIGIVLYDPVTVHPILSTEGEDQVLLGTLEDTARR